jgi:hypothetical protein
LVLPEVDRARGARAAQAALEFNARPGLSIQLANRRGLRPVLDELRSHRTDALGPRERVHLGLEVVSRAQESWP